MGKDNFLTPKAIANRIKAKGLQKLRWYCQMCEKQCRDENGFKCHCSSESHQRQMILFAETPDKFINSYSSDFEKDFLKLLSRRFGTRRVAANSVYQEYISDRNHLHMNATIWTTLSDFVKYLGKEGICEVDETEKGWFMRWIDRRPETLARQEAVLRKERAEQDEEEREQKLIQEQIEKARSQQTIKETVATELKRNEGEEKIKLNLSLKSVVPKTTGFKMATTSKIGLVVKPVVKKNVLKEVAKKLKSTSSTTTKDNDNSNTNTNRGTSASTKLSNIDFLMKQDLLSKKGRNNNKREFKPRSTPFSDTNLKDNKNINSFKSQEKDDDTTYIRKDSSRANHENKYNESKHTERISEHKKDDDNISSDDAKNRSSNEHRHKHSHKHSSSRSRSPSRGHSHSPSRDHGHGHGHSHSHSHSHSRSRSYSNNDDKHDSKKRKY